MTPVILQGHLHTSPQLRYWIDLRIMAGWAPRVRMVDSSRPRKAKKPKQKKKRQKGKKRIGFQSSQLRTAIPQLVSDVFGAIQLDQLHVDIAFGLDDPADTGVCHGYLMSFQNAVAPLRDGTISIQPDYTGTQLAGRADATVRVSPIHLIFAAIRFGWQTMGPQR